MTEPIHGVVGACRRDPLDGELGPLRVLVHIELAIQNFNLALVVALSILANRLYLGPALVYLPFMLIFAGIVMAIGHRGRGLEGAA